MWPETTEQTSLDMLLFSRGHAFGFPDTPGVVRTAACLEHSRYENRAYFTGSSFTTPPTG